MTYSTLVFLCIDSKNHSISTKKSEGIRKVSDEIAENAVPLHRNFKGWRGMLTQPKRLPVAVIVKCLKKIQLWQQENLLTCV